MIDTEDVAMLTRITGIALSIASVVIMVTRPFEPVASTLLVYFLLIAAAVFVMVGQILTVRINSSGEFADASKRREAVYDIATIGGVMVLFVVFYVYPFVQTHTSWLS